MSSNCNDFVCGPFPSQYMVSISGITNNLCTGCAGLNQSFVVSATGGGGVIPISPAICGLFEWDNLTASPCFIAIQLHTDFPSPEWSGDLTDPMNGGVIPYTGGSGNPMFNQCSYGSSICTVTPIPFAANTDPQTLPCIPAVQAGCAPGSNVGCAGGTPPYPPGAACCDPPQPGECNQDEFCPCPGCADTVSLVLITIADGCQNDCHYECPPGTTPIQCDQTNNGSNGGNGSSGNGNGGNGGSGNGGNGNGGSGSGSGSGCSTCGTGSQAPAANGQVNNLAAAGPGDVSFSSGNFMVPLPGVAGGGFSPVPNLTYNSVSTQSGAFGYGWVSLFDQRIGVIDTQTVTITKGTGTLLTYSNKDGGGHYLPPGGVANALVQNGDNTWTETQPDGFQLRYDTTGKLYRLQSVAGSRWTISRDGGGKVTRIVDPTTARTTFVYDGSRKTLSGGWSTRREESPASPSTAAAT